MSIIRVGLAETKKFAEGYSAIFGSKKKKNEETEGTEKPTQDKQEGANKNAKDAKKKTKK